MKQTKSSTWPSLILSRLSALALILFLALAFTSCDKDEPKTDGDREEIERENPRNLLSNYAWKPDSFFDEALQINKNVASLTIYFLPNGKALQRVIYTDWSKPGETIRCLSYKGIKWSETGLLYSIGLYVDNGTRICEFEYARPECGGPHLYTIDHPDWAGLVLVPERLTEYDTDFIETYSSMEVGEFKEIDNTTI